MCDLQFQTELYNLAGISTIINNYAAYYKVHGFMEDNVYSMVVIQILENLFNLI